MAFLFALRLVTISLLICAFSVSNTFSYQKNRLFLDISSADYGAIKRIKVTFTLDRLLKTNRLLGVSIQYRLDAKKKNILARMIDMNQVEVEQIYDIYYYMIDIPTDLIKGHKLSVTLIDNTTNTAITSHLSFPKETTELPCLLINRTNNREFNYHKITDTLFFKYSIQQPIYIYKFVQNFGAAPPPMASGTFSGQRNMRVDTLITLLSNTSFVLPEAGLYFAQIDTTTDIGLGLTVVDEYFPKFRKMDQLAATTIYISTASEIKALKNVADKKPIFDNFWFNLAQSREKAQSLVQLYFKRVTYANKNFTTYKEGWKTDRGIIYIVFGHPDQITKTTYGESWQYNLATIAQVITFDFEERTSLFAQNDYALERKTGYRPIWHTMIKQWRSGKIRE